ncbi:hypothetical protein PINS_up022289 [Pythium insidiosum]|nr:hypothetical protein PINS_up022289 [Pythium insidiosum]
MPMSHDATLEAPRASLSSMIPSFQGGNPNFSSTSNGLLSNNPSLDEVASQFSVDQPSQSGSSFQHADVEYIVSRTIESMNRNFEQRLTQFLMRLEFQQQEKNMTQLQSLATKVEACERAIPRLEARLDVLADRIATSSAQISKVQSEITVQLQQMQQDIQIKTQQQILGLKASSSSQQVVNQLATSTPLTMVMQGQVEELVAMRIRASEQAVQGECARLRRDSVTSQSVVDAVSQHLSQFKQEFEGNQVMVLRRFTENIVKDGVRLEDRMSNVESKVAHLESIIQAEQQASLLALEAISEAFTHPPPAPAPLSADAGVFKPAPVAPYPSTAHIRHSPQVNPNGGMSNVTKRQNN